MLNAKLVVVGGDAKASEISLKLPTVIGRGKDVSLTLPHALVSRRHTEIFVQDGWLFVRDLGSLNGTYVNNRRIKDAQKLLPNHLLTLGNVTFRAVYESPEAPSEKTPDTPNVSEIHANLGAQALLVAESGVADNPAVANLHLRQDQQSELAPASSSIFSGDEEFVTPDKSICLNALESLPVQAAASSVSLIGDQLNEVGGPKKPAVDSIDLDFSDAGSVLHSDADLGSFLRKMPR